MSDGDLVRLRPVEEPDLPALGRLDTDPALSKPFEWTGFRDPRARRRRWEQDGYLGDDYSLLIVALPDGTFAGFAREGVMRGAAFVGGRWRDAALHARLPQDPPPPAWAERVAPSVLP